MDLKLQMIKVSMGIKKVKTQLSISLKNDKGTDAMKNKSHITIIQNLRTNSFDIDIIFWIMILLILLFFHRATRMSVFCCVYLIL